MTRADYLEIKTKKIRFDGFTKGPLSLKKRDTSSVTFSEAFKTKLKEGRLYTVVIPFPVNSDAGVSLSMKSGEIVMSLGFSTRISQGHDREDLTIDVLKMLYGDAIWSFEPNSVLHKNFSAYFVPATVPEKK